MWTRRGSNSRPLPCKGSALPTELRDLHRSVYHESATSQLVSPAKSCLLIVRGDGSFVNLSDVNTRPRHTSGSVDANGKPIGGRWKNTKPDILPIEPVEMPTSSECNKNECSQAASDLKYQLQKMRDRESYLASEYVRTRLAVDQATKEQSEADRCYKLLQDMIEANYVNYVTEIESIVHHRVVPDLLRTPEKAAKRMLQCWSKATDYDGPLTYDNHCRTVIDSIPDESVVIAADGTTIKDLKDNCHNRWQERLNQDTVFACSILSLLYSRDLKIRAPGQRMDDQVVEFVCAVTDQLSNALLQADYALYEAEEACETCPKDWLDDLTEEDIESFCEDFEKAYDLGVPECEEAAMLYATLVAKSS